jgi:hypothetical protein
MRELILNPQVHPLPVIHDMPVPSIEVNSSLLDRKGLMGCVCLSVCLYVTPLLQHYENHMSSGNKGNQPERKLATIREAGSYDINLYTEYLYFEA